MRERENDEKKGRRKITEGTSATYRDLQKKKKRRKMGLQAKRDERGGERGLGGSATCPPCYGSFKYLLEI